MLVLQAHVGVDKEAALNWREGGEKGLPKVFDVSLFLVLIRLSEQHP